MSKLFALSFFIVVATHSFAQDTLLVKNTVGDFSLKKVTIQHNNFYYNENKIDLGSLSNLINSSNTIDQVEKIKLISEFKKYNRLKSNKNGFPIVASSSFILGAVFSYLTFIDGGKRDVIILSAIFGTVSIGFTFGSVINDLKFRKKKKELIKQLAL